ncbi:MAG: hypothetical protein L0956_06935 [Candidatus Mariimomonas ferrooxydans]
MKRYTTWLLTAAFLITGMLTVPPAMAGEILDVSVSPNPIVGLPKLYTITITGTGYCDHLTVYYEISEGGITNKSSIWHKQKFWFNTLTKKTGKVSVDGHANNPETYLVTAEPGPGAKNCGDKVASTTLKIYEKLPLIVPKTLEQQKPLRRKM